MAEENTPENPPANAAASIDETVRAALSGSSANKRQLMLWFGALILGGILGWMGFAKLNALFDFIASAFTRMFQFVAIPTIALAVMTTLSRLGAQRDTGRIFARALTYTLLTTFAASLVALLMYLLIAPGNLPADIVGAGAAQVPEKTASMSYYDHILSVIPNNALNAFLSGNVLSVLIIAAAVGLALAFMPESDGRRLILTALDGLQELLFTLIRALLWILPLGILAFSAQLAAQIEAGVIVGALGKYVAVVMGSNIIQIAIVLPLFLLARGLNPLYVFRQMSPALAVALLTNSSAGTLPVTLATAEKNLHVNPKVSRFVLPICTTINMNGCAAFILVTSLFVMQNAGVQLSIGQMLVWLCISVIAAVGNAGVPMGCYFLTLSLMSAQGVPLGLMGVILPIYAVIDMVETAENVWSDSTVCTITDHELRGTLDAPVPAAA